MVSDYSIRLADIADLGAIVEHRCKMISELRNCDAFALNIMSEQFREWVEPKLRSHEYRAWFATNNEKAIVAGLGLWILDWPPYILPSGLPGLKRAYVLNVYTESDHRKKGLSRPLVETAIEWCRINSFSMISLHASKYGRHLYETAGFEPTSEMRLVLE